MTFAEAARRAAGAATGLLGWRPDDFWAATPADLMLAIEARQPGGAGVAELKQMMERDGG